jgi:hypothetical protein
MRSGLRAAFGLVLVLHGLGNAVLPMRGVDAVAPGVWAPAFTVLYAVAIVGFVAAGLGVLGIHPLRYLVIPATAIASIGSLFGYARLADTDLWPGVVLSLMLPIGAIAWAAYPAPHAVERRSLFRRRAADLAGIAFLAWIIAAAVLWPWTRTWGSEPSDWMMPLPGDRSPRAPAMEILHGVTIEAPPAAVWPWLVQLGQDRAGFYSYERLERLFGVDVRNVRDIRPEWQRRSAGDQVHATQPDYLGGIFGERPGWTVDLVDPDRAMVLRYWGAFVLAPYDQGRTRFLIRSTISNPEIPVLAAAVNLTAFELPHFIMQRRMMLNIKELAEDEPRRRSAR